MTASERSAVLWLWLVLVFLFGVIVGYCACIWQMNRLPPPFGL